MAFPAKLAHYCLACWHVQTGRRARAVTWAPAVTLAHAGAGDPSLCLALGRLTVIHGQETLVYCSIGYKGCRPNPHFVPAPPRHSLDQCSSLVLPPLCLFFFVFGDGRSVLGPVDTPAGECVPSGRCATVARVPTVVVFADEVRKANLVVSWSLAPGSCLCDSIHVFSVTNVCMK